MRAISKIPRRKRRPPVSSTGDEVSVQRPARDVSANRACVRRPRAEPRLFARTRCRGTRSALGAATQDGRSGLTALPLPPDYGGMGGSVVDTTILLEEIGRSSLSVASMLNFAIGFGCETVKRFGSEEQKQDLLPKIVSGEMCFAFSLTEPDAGSAAAIRTRAVADGDEYVINGTKIFTTGASEARCLVVATRTDIEADRHRGISLLIVDPKSEGITCRNIVKLGMRGAGGLYEVRYDGVRLSQAAYCIGCAQHVIDEAVRYAGERCIKEASMANLACTEALLRVTEDCIRVYGGYGLTMEFDIQRHFRDARLFVIGDGSSQIQRNLIARGMGL